MFQTMSEGWRQCSWFFSGNVRSYESRLARGWSLWMTGAALGLAAHFLSGQLFSKPCQEKKVKNPVYWERYSMWAVLVAALGPLMWSCAPHSQVRLRWSASAYFCCHKAGPGPRHVWRPGFVAACSQPNFVRHNALLGGFFSAKNEKKRDMFVALLSVMMYMAMMTVVKCNTQAMVNKDVAWRNNKRFVIAIGFHNWV